MNSPAHDGLLILIEAIKQGINDGSIRQHIDLVKTAATLWGATTGMIQIISTKGDHLQKDHGVDKNDLMKYAFELIKFSIQNKSHL